MTKQDGEMVDVTLAVARLHAGVLAIVCGFIGGVGLFTMTVWLVIKGGPEVGSHLALLGQYLPGYSVTWGGSLLGLLYGTLIGAVGGWLFGAVYNGVVGLRQ